VNELATRVVEVRASGLQDFAGTYAEYLEKLGDDHLDGDAVALRAKVERGEEKAAGKGAAKPSAAPVGSWEEQKKKRNRAAQLPKLRDKVTAEIEKAEGRKREIDGIYAEPGFFQRASREEIDALIEEAAALGPRIEGLFKEWEEIERELSGMDVD
jgi:hypothetical protein